MRPAARTIHSAGRCSRCSSRKLGGSALTDFVAHTGSSAQQRIDDLAARAHPLVEFLTGRGIGWQARLIWIDIPNRGGGAANGLQRD
jgi:hypothetical protein